MHKELGIFIAIQIFCMGVSFFILDGHEIFFHTIIAYAVIDCVVFWKRRALIFSGKVSRFAFYISPIVVFLIMIFVVPKQ